MAKNHYKLLRITKGCPLDAAYHTRENSEFGAAWLGENGELWNAKKGKCHSQKWPRIIIPGELAREFGRSALEARWDVRKEPNHNFNAIMMAQRASAVRLTRRWKAHGERILVKRPWWNRSWWEPFTADWDGFMNSYHCDLMASKRIFNANFLIWHSESESRTMRSQWVRQTLCVLMGSTFLGVPLAQSARSFEPSVIELNSSKFLPLRHFLVGHPKRWRSSIWKASSRSIRVKREASSSREASLSENF